MNLLSKSVIVVVIAFIVGLSLYYDGRVDETSSIMKFPHVNDVSSVMIVRENKEPVQLQKIEAAKILYWLSHAEYVGPAKHDPFLSRGAAYTVIKAKDGRTFTVTSAIDIISMNEGDFELETGISVYNQITVGIDHRRLRYIAPEMKQWLMQSSMEAAAQEKMERELKRIAWELLSETTKQTVKGDWEQANIEKIHPTTTIPLRYPDKSASNAYKVTFFTNQDAMLGPIGIYIDADTKEILGQDGRD
jgi:hypothetical protein